jgi:putative ABC transport system substrate-binding protein
MATHVLRFVLRALLVALSVPAAAQPPQPIPRIGFPAVPSLAAIAARVEASRQGLRALGYVEGHHLVIEYRSAGGNLDRAPALAAELVRLTVEVIVAAGPMDTRHAKHATATMPMGMTWDHEPVGSGFGAGLARPGGHVTGLSSLAPELSGTPLELLTPLGPRLARVAFLGHATAPGHAQAVSATAAARAWGVRRPCSC